MIRRGAFRILLALVVTASMLVCPAAVGAAPDETVSSVSGDRYFPQTGFWISDDTIWDYFLKRGGVKTFGYPASRKFLFRGTEVQFFQRGVIQIKPDGRPGQLNILDKGLLEYNVANGATFPRYDETLVASAPRHGSANYQTALLDWITKHVPNVWQGAKVNFLQVFLNTVKFYEAYPDGSGNPNWMPGINLEMWGAVTSRPAPDPNNGNFIYLRFQRGIMHYDKASGHTQGLLLGDHLKSIITGRDLPADLEAKAKGSALYRQHDDTKPNGVARPEQLPDTNLKDAFAIEGEFALSPSATVDIGPIQDWPQHDQDAILGLVDVFHEEISLTQLTSDFPWLADGLTTGERRTIISLLRIAQEGASLTRLILSYPWLSDDLTEVEQAAIGDLQHIAQGDISLARHILSSSWLADGLTEEERWITANLRNIVLEDPEFASDLTRTSLLDDPFGSIQLDAIASLAKMHNGRLERLGTQAWFKDGLTNEDLALIVVLNNVVASKELFSILIQDGQVHSETFFVPSAGEINLYVIRRGSLTHHDDIFEVMKMGIQTIEDFMDVPWKKRDVIVLLEPEWRFPGWSLATGVNYFTHIVVRDPDATTELKRVLYHELAHFYWSQETSPKWFHEGSAQLLAYYSLDVAEQLQLTDRLDEAIDQSKEYCQPHGATNIHEFLHATAGQTVHDIWQSNLAYCPHILGEAFLLGMYVGLGKDVVSSSLHNLYMISQSSGEPVSEHDIYRVFLANTPSGEEAKFREIYQRFHGGPAPDS